MRLIDADALAKNGWVLERHGVSNTLIERMSIADVPTIEAEPVKHGVWDFVAENSTGKIFLCSACWIPYNPSEKEVDRGRLQERPNYCPNCGARMDGDSNG